MAGELRGGLEIKRVGPDHDPNIKWYAQTSAIKQDNEKTRVDLLDAEWLEGTGRALKYGRDKYTEYGECTCLVSIVNEIVKYGPKDFVNLATILRINKAETPSINAPIENSIRKDSTNINVNIWLGTLTSKLLDGEMKLKRSTNSLANNLIYCLYKRTVEYVGQLNSYVLTTITLQDKLERDFVKDVTSLLASLKELSGTIRHESTCESLKIVSIGDHNWRGGFKWSRLIGACMRHLLAIMRREDVDPESGLLHVDHLSCSVMFLAWHIRNKPELDDRWKP